MFKILSNRLYTTLSVGTLWTGLGTKRGADLYDSQKNFTYLYSDKLIYCLYGAVIYINPLFSIFTLHKELYRLEVMVRKLEKDDDYYQLL
jgi:hypothetical protein